MRPLTSELSSDEGLRVGQRMDKVTPDPVLIIDASYKRETSSDDDINRRVTANRQTGRATFNHHTHADGDKSAAKLTRYAAKRGVG